MPRVVGVGMRGGSLVAVLLRAAESDRVCHIRRAVPQTLGKPFSVEDEAGA